MTEPTIVNWPEEEVKAAHDFLVEEDSDFYVGLVFYLILYLKPGLPPMEAAKVTLAIYRQNEGEVEL